MRVHLLGDVTADCLYLFYAQFHQDKACKFLGSKPRAKYMSVCSGATILRWPPLASFLPFMKARVRNGVARGITRYQYKCM